MTRSGLFCVVAITIILLISNAFAVRQHKNMLESKLAEVVLTTRQDLKTIQQSGGIISTVEGNRVEVYLLPEDFNRLRALGYSVRYIRDVSAEYGKELWERTRGSRNPLDDYHTNDEIEDQFEIWQNTYPTLFSYESIGQSVEGRDLWMGKVSDNVTLDEPEIEVKYISTMHGDEVVGIEMCLNLIGELLTNNGMDPELTELLEDYEIWFLPLMNPDGMADVQRYNANGVDLNRDFPDRVDDSTNTTTGRQIETAHVMNWSAQHNCILSANFHGGAIVTNYPWDSNYSGSDIYSPTPEDDLFVHLSLSYSQYNSPMYNGPFSQGITNGADWYEVRGGMQDWNYVWMGDKEVTVELYGTKWPNYSVISGLWDDNRLSMRYYLLEAKYGVRGIVTDSTTGEPLRADVQLEDIPYLTHSSALHGEYYRILEDGTYSLTFSAPGYESKTISSVVVSNPDPTILNVELARTASPIVSTDPEEIDETIGPCTTTDIAFTIENSGEVALDWSAEEAYVNLDGYGSSTGGGWRFIDSDQPDGPVYNWIDISSIGTSLSFSDDDQNLGPYSIGFDYPFYGVNRTTLRVSANGWISFTSSESDYDSYTNRYLPGNDAPENLIAAWWDDLSPQRTGANVYLYTNNTDSLIITFENVQSYQGGGLYTFQCILLSSGSILFQYQDMGTERLNSSTIGLQNADKTKGSTVIYNEYYIQDEMAVAYCPNSMIELIPSSGTVAPLGNQPVTARLNSCCLPDGESTGILNITSNDPVTPLLEVPVTITVALSPPDPVADLTIVPEGGDIRLHWTASADASSYYIYRSDVWPVEDAPEYYLDSTTETTYLDGSAASEISYYLITAVR